MTMFAWPVPVMTIGMTPRTRPAADNEQHVQHCVAEIAEPARENADLDQRKGTSSRNTRRAPTGTLRCDDGCRCGVPPSGPGCGRAWWAHFEFTRTRIELTILPKKIEERSA